MQDAPIRKSPGRRRILSLLLLAASVSASFGVLFLPRNTAQQLALGYFGVFLVALFSAASLFIPGPSMIMAFAAGHVLNPALVGIVAALGSTLGEITGYGVGRAGQDITRDHRFYKAERLMSRFGSLALFVLAATPNFLYDAAGIIAGLTGYSLVKFLSISFLGKLVRFSVTAYLGYFIIE